MLLSDPATQQFLSESVIAVWESVAPVPKVTIDLGNGTTLKRTLGGNTVLTLLTSEGSVVDAYPGVYTPRDFQKELRPGLEFIAQTSGKPTPMHLAAWHEERARVAIASARVGTTASKTGIESPILDTLGFFTPIPLTTPRLTLPTTTLTEQPGGGAMGGRAQRLVDMSKVALSAKQLRSSVAITPGATPEQAGEQLVRWDSATNVSSVRPVVHLYLSAFKEQVPERRDFRDTLYREVLHIPLGDPYLGLRDAVVPGTK